MVCSARSHRTLTNYIHWVNRWVVYASSKRFATFPATAVQVAQFLTTIGASSPSGVPVAAAALRFVHGLFAEHLINPLDSALCKMAVEVAKRSYAAGCKRKQVLQPQQVALLLQHLCKSPVPFRKLRLACMIAVAFGGVLRIDEVLHLRRQDVTFTESHVELFLYKSKTDQHRHGNSVLIANSSSSISCHLLLSLYLQKWPSQSPGRRLFPVSYNVALADLKATIGQCHLPPGDFGWHSLRSGAASAALNRGVDYDAVKAAGRWKSTHSVDRYLDRSTLNRLKVSVALRL